MQRSFLVGSLGLIIAMASLTGCRSAPAADTVRVETLLRSTTSWDGQDLPDYEAGEAEVTVLRITVPPGVALPEHQHPMINVGVLLEGQLVVTSEDGDQLALHAGDAIVETVDTWHYGRNPGPDPAVIIVFYASTPGQPLAIPSDGQHTHE